MIGFFKVFGDLGGRAGWLGLYLLLLKVRTDLLHLHLIHELLLSGLLLYLLCAREPVVILLLLFFF
jgi:hypothetical protein